MTRKWTCRASVSWRARFVTHFSTLLVSLPDCSLLQQIEMNFSCTSITLLYFSFTFWPRRTRLRLPASTRTARWPCSQVLVMLIYLQFRRSVSTCSTHPFLETALTISLFASWRFHNRLIWHYRLFKSSLKRSFLKLSCKSRPASSVLLSRLLTYCAWLAACVPVRLPMRGLLPGFQESISFLFLSAAQRFVHKKSICTTFRRFIVLLRLCASWY